MILNLDNVYIDVDKVAFLDKSTGRVVVDGCELSDIDDVNMELVEKAFIWIHHSHMYNEKLSKIRWIKGEK